jgi:hypothetical protein
MAESEGASDAKAGAESPADEDDTRRKFREALERKQRQHHATAAGAERDGAEKSHGAKGPTKSRSFRRKAI